MSLQEDVPVRSIGCGSGTDEPRASSRSASEDEHLTVEDTDSNSTPAGPRSLRFLGKDTCRECT